MTQLDPAVRGESMERLIELAADPNVSRAVRIKAQAKLRELSGQGNRELRRTT